MITLPVDQATKGKFKQLKVTEVFRKMYTLQFTYRFGSDKFRHVPVYMHKINEWTIEANELSDWLSYSTYQCSLQHS